MEKLIRLHIINQSFKTISLLITRSFSSYWISTGIICGNSPRGSFVKTLEK
jgi:hypothetical protein